MNTEFRWSAGRIAPLIDALQETTDRFSAMSTFDVLFSSAGEVAGFESDTPQFEPACTISDGLLIKLLDRRLDDPIELMAISRDVPAEIPAGQAPDVAEALRRAWHKEPDSRLGQLVYNRTLVCFHNPRTPGPWMETMRSIEDDWWLALFREVSDMTVPSIPECAARATRAVAPIR